jgi:hypothetical protein
VAWYGWRALRGARWRPGLAALVAWSAAAAVVYVLVWPSMWVDPVGTVQEVLAKAVDEGASPHDSGNYFLGRPVEDPGPLFYPVAAAFRLTPLALAGLLAAAWTVARRREGGEDGRSLVLRLAAWAVFFTAFMTIGPKKFDRYLLPALAALDVVAGIGLAWLGGALWGRLRDSGRRPLPSWAVTAGIVALVQGSVALSALPYPLAYYNPLLGGTTAAPRVLLVGWGEGYDIAARCLNGEPGAADRVAAVRGLSNFAPLFAGQTRSTASYKPGRTDYVVLYISQLQRGQDMDVIASYSGVVPPLCTGTIGGLDYVWVYRNRTIQPVLDALAAVGEPGDVVVAGGEAPVAHQYGGPLPLVRYWGHWGEPEVRESLEVDFPPDWRRAWVVRYPGADPPVVLDVLATVAERGDTQALAEGQVELTPFTRADP